MEQLGNDFATTLAAAITTVGQTAITVASGTGAPAANFRCRIDDELVLVTSTGAGTNWTIERGVEGTTAATHLLGADVAHVVTEGGLKQHLLERGWLARDQLVAAGETMVVEAGTTLVVFQEIDVAGTLDAKGRVASI